VTDISRKTVRKTFQLASRPLWGKKESGIYDYREVRAQFLPPGVKIQETRKGGERKQKMGKA